METYHCRQGKVPLLISIPHSGTHLPEDVATEMTAAALALPDTDWHVDVLYNFLDELDATVVVATHSRYVIDLNRSPEDVLLYPGQTETGLCPVNTFDGEPIYLDGGLDVAQIQHRRETFWQPYHDRLHNELVRLRKLHSRVVLWDAHSIRSKVPLVFKGELPVLNLGTNSGHACDETLSSGLIAMAKRATQFPAVLNGRFTGGYITRNYGNPADGVHAVQLELAQRSYMQEVSPFSFDVDKAMEIRPVIRNLLSIALEFVAM